MTSVTKFIPTTKAEQELVLEEIKKVALLASKYTGRIVGDFVIAKYFEFCAGYEFEKIDKIYLLFDNNSYIDEFVKVTSLKQSSGSYHQLFKFGALIAEFQLIIGYGLSCLHDCLFLKCKEVNWCYGVLSPCTKRPSTIIQDLDKKIAKPFQYYTEVLRKGRKDACQELIDKFLSKGWEVQLFVDEKKEYKHYIFKGDKITVDDLVKLITEKAVLPDQVLKQVLELADKQEDVEKRVADIEDALGRALSRLSNMKYNINDVAANVVNVENELLAIEKMVDNL